MNNHHPLCYNDEWKDSECDLCIIIKYVIAGLTPLCTCASNNTNGSYLNHELMCKYGAFMYSQNRKHI